MKYFITSVVIVLMFLSFQYGRVFDLGAKSLSVELLNETGKLTHYNTDTYYIISKDMTGNTVLTHDMLRNLYNITSYNEDVLLIAEDHKW